MLQPSGYAVKTPPEFHPYGWTTIDLWCAPFISGLYAFLTHAQPFWTEMHFYLVDMWRRMTFTKSPVALSGWLDHVNSNSFFYTTYPMSKERARAVCALILMALFVGRTLRNFGGFAEWKRTIIVENVLGEKPRQLHGELLLKDWSSSTI